MSDSTTATIQDNESPTLVKITNGEYKVPPLTAVPPALPLLLRKTTAELDDDQIQEMLAERAKYREQQAQYRKAVEDREAMIELVMDQLRLDLQQEFGLEDNEQAKLLFSLCKTYAEGNNISLFGFYEDLHVLVK
jgi:hypothetical protein